MAGDGAAVARERVVQGHADLDQDGAALLGGALLVRQHAQRGVHEAGEGREDRHRGLQRLDVVGGDLQQTVALLDALADEAELAVLEVADAAVDHVADDAAEAPEA